jgi:hypothetical protein
MALEYPVAIVAIDFDICYEDFRVLGGRVGLHEELGDDWWFLVFGGGRVHVLVVKKSQHI